MYFYYNITPFRVFSKRRILLPFPAMAIRWRLRRPAKRARIGNFFRLNRDRYEQMKEDGKKLEF